ncbi:DNA-(apurinic or apyrimidinic site) lyase 2 isoform X2 [Strongylocentrotus purpuratus]|uniref:DNA-(apurinic or apyrimidinic site) endonuclease n=1 Tax=Strongylocentrotus purpuratus TaxID=7668 RepID=A0A7M7RDG5_STRPU|nr:DNA-(apurinic or apyrimidinic site) lyase 2 isoform X2 [Strongylocentrotus purpuratus]|eukprot:XP_784420.3 PREDICTED: DNA-(apurinic or apyrimidinic site) lyase 2 isoform X2 [Strongylocentrotus purpuratus]
MCLTLAWHVVLSRSLSIHIPCSLTKMKVLTWNINGLRACKVPLKELFANLDADIICLQETKITRDQLDNDLVNVDDYNAYFSFSKKRSGYSGVATYCKNSTTPVIAEEGLTGLLSHGTKQSLIGCYGDQSAYSPEELLSIDAEGRTIITQHQYRKKDGALGDLVIINVYCPRAGDDNPERKSFKMRFYNLLQLRAEAMLQAGKSVVIVGDVNASHRRIDHCDPSGNWGKFESHPSRKWLDGFLKDCSCPETAETSPSSQDDLQKSPQEEQELSDEERHVHDDSNIDVEDIPSKDNLFVDSFRYFHPKRENAFTCWSTLTGARQTNYGTRIDYIIVNERLCVDELTECDIMPEFEGSDHCPVKATLLGGCSPAEQLHPMCAKLMPEVAGKQQKLSNFFQKVSPSKKFEMHEKAMSGENKQGGRSRLDIGKREGQSLVGKPGKRAKTDGKVTKTGNIASFFKKKADAKLRSQTDLEIHQSSSSSYNTRLMPNSQRSDGDIDNGSDFQNRLKDIPVDSGISGSDDAVSDASQIVKETSQELFEDKPKAKQQLASAWKNLFKGPPPSPMCKGHQEPCLLRTVKKAGPNLGKQFFVCKRPEGHKNNPEARCNHFEWVSKKLNLKSV